MILVKIIVSFISAFIGKKEAYYGKKNKIEAFLFFLGYYFIFFIGYFSINTVLYSENTLYIFFFALTLCLFSLTYFSNFEASDRVEINKIRVVIIIPLWLWVIFVIFYVSWYG